MRPRKIKLPAWWERETHFEVPPVPAVPFRGTRETEIEQFKERLLREALRDASDPDFYAPLRQAANEASGVAWMTPFPLLFLPELFKEIAAVARRQFERAHSVRSRSAKILALLF